MFGKKIRGLALVLALTMAAAQPVSATSLDEQQKALEQQQAQTKSNLASQQSKINELEKKKAALQEEIDQMDSELIELMAEIKTLKGDIEDKETDIETTKGELDTAKQDQAKQYDSMKTRIAYIYENGGNAAWAEMILSDANISNLLNKAEYTQEIYDYDRKALETYVATVENVQELERTLESEKAELVTMKEESEEEEKELNAALEKKKQTSANYAVEISAAEKKAQEYSDLIRQQSAQIRQIQQEKAAQEAARKAAEEAKKRAEAERKAAEEAAKKAAAANNAASSGSTSGGSTSSGSTSGGSTSSGSTSSGSSSSGGSSGASHSGRGSSVVAYATQFVGNPYVWGGESLTNGADCSGFIKSVYAHFGVSLPHSSAAMRSCGVGVSYSEAMPGDIICYSGHVAIYMGGGAIVHASNKKDGIKISYNAAYRTIVAVRRVI